MLIVGIATMLGQAAVPAVTDAAPLPQKLQAVPRCDADASGDILVCGQRTPNFRLEPLPPSYDAAALPKAQAPLLGGTGSVELEQGDVGGTPSNRIMARMKWHF